MNPLNWGPEIYVALIVVVLSLRLFVPWPEAGLARFAEEVCLILPAGLLYFLVRGLEKSDAATAEAHARSVIEFERSLGIFVEPQLQELIVHRSALINLVNWIYVWAHWPVILAWVVWMWTRHRDDYPVYRNAVLISGAAGMVVFALYPVAPPRLMAELNMADTISMRSHSYRVLQPPSLTNLYAAMPSLHFGWNLLVGVAIVRHARPLIGRLGGIVLPIAMFAAIVLTANHYIVDGIAGAAFALAGLVVAAYVTPRWSPALANFARGRVWSPGGRSHVGGCP